MAIRHEKVGGVVKQYIQCVTHCTHNLWGDHPWLGGTIYGAIDSPGGPSMAAIVSPGGLPVATKFAVDGPAGPILGGPSVA